MITAAPADTSRKKPAISVQGTQEGSGCERPAGRWSRVRYGVMLIRAQTVLVGGGPGCVLTPQASAIWSTRNRPRPDTSRGSPPWREGQPGPSSVTSSHRVRPSVSAHSLGDAAACSIALVTSSPTTSATPGWSWCPVRCRTASRASLALRGTGPSAISSLWGRRLEPIVAVGAVHTRSSIRR
jgi:hypothetical protein